MSSNKDEKRDELFKPDFELQSDLAAGPFAIDSADKTKNNRRSIGQNTEGTPKAEKN